MISVLRWLGKNLGTFLMAFILALIVWVSAVISEDPNVEEVLQRPVPVEKIGLDPGLLIIGNATSQVQLTINAPTSVWRDIRNNDDQIHAWIDLSGLGPGEHMLPVKIQVKPATARVVVIDPEQIEVNLERLVSQTYSVTLDVQGDPALGYDAGDVVYTPTQVTLSGAESLVAQVQEVYAALDITRATQTITSTIPLRARDPNGRVVPGVAVTPDSISVRQPIHLLGGFRNVIVKVTTTGQVAEGYKLTNISVTPPNVVVFSSDPELLNQLPGYVETQPLDLDGAQDYLEIPLDLNLPDGVTSVNDRRVLVQVSIAPIESNLSISLPVDSVGLAPGLSAQVAPLTVDVIISGPLPVLDTLQPSDLQIIVDLTGLEPGTYTLEPQVEFLPPRLKLESMLPNSLEVTIIVAPTPTITATPDLQVTPTQTPRP